MRRRSAAPSYTYHLETLTELALIVRRLAWTSTDGITVVAHFFACSTLFRIFPVSCLNSPGRRHLMRFFPKTLGVPLLATNEGACCACGGDSALAAIGP